MVKNMAASIHTKYVLLIVADYYISYQSSVCEYLNNVDRSDVVLDYKYFLKAYLFLCFK